MEIHTSKLGPILKVVPKGILDSYSSFDLVRFIKSRWEEGDRLFLLVSKGIEYLEEEGISALTELRNFFEKQGGHIAFSNWNEENSLVLSLFGLNKTIHFFVSEKEAEIWLSSLKIEDRRTKSETYHGDISGLRQTKPVQFYSGTSSPISKTDDYIPELSTIPIPGAEIKSESKREHSISENLEKSLEQTRTVFQEKILFCESCHSRLRIKSIGRHQCPDCGIQFDVSRTGGVRYLEKLLS